MRVPLGIFVQFIMVLIVVLVWFYQRADLYFTQHDGSQEQLRRLNSKLEQKEFENRISQLEIEKVKYETLALIEKENILPENLLVKSHIREGLRSPASIQELDFSLLRVEELRSLFKEKKYSQVISLGEKLIKNEKSFLVKPEVLFFLSESYYLNHQYEKAVEKINQLVSLYPEHIMTGYSLLRLATISEKSEQFNEADSIYRIIISQFKDKALISEAKKSQAKLSE